MGALFSRFKVWDDFETLFNEDLNSEFNNILNNLSAFLISGASENVIQFLTTLDPGDVGSENLPSSIAEEIQMLRFQIEAIIGGNTWIDDPSTSLLDVSNALAGAGLLRDNRIVAGEVDASGQPGWLRAEGSAAQINLLATSTELQTFINGAQVDFDADLSFSPLSLAPNSNNTCAVDDSAIAGAESTKLLGERDSQIPIGSIGAEISAKNGQVAAFKADNGADIEYFIAQVDTAATLPNLKNAFRGYFFDDSGLNTPRITISDTDVITLMRLTWVFATNVGGTRGLDVTLNQPLVQSDTPTSPGSGDYWFDLNTNEWKKFTGAVFEVADAIFVGLCIQDDTNCVAARSADFTRGYSKLNSCEVEKLNDNTVSTKYQNPNVNAYGTEYFYESANLEWQMPGDLDSGEIDSVTTDYYLYVTQDGDPRLSTVPPANRACDLFGEYHPSKPYRAVGRVTNDGSSDFTTVQSYGEEGKETFYAGMKDPGEIKQIVNTLPPTGWLICDGSAVSRTTYAALFDYMGTSFGAGNGTTTFNIPDVRARVMQGLNNVSLPNGVNGGLSTRNLGATFGSEIHQHTILDHTHSNTEQFAWAYWNTIANSGTWTSANMPRDFLTDVKFIHHGIQIDSGVFPGPPNVWYPAAPGYPGDKAYTESKTWSTASDGPGNTEDESQSDPGRAVNMIIKY